MDFARIVRHLFTTEGKLKRVLPEGDLAAIEKAIAASELRHNGEIRFAVEAALGTAALIDGESARERSIEVFATLHVWDTAQNNGVLIYLLLADRDVEIVADRGIHSKVGDAQWEAICRTMESAFSEGRYKEGVIGGIEAVAEQLALHFPGSGDAVNELPDKAVMIQAS
jgi:TLP18.3/Psb32/MOLO-1 phosphatase superfamily protein